MEVLRIVGIMAQPVMPTAAGALLDLLAVGQGDRTFVAVAEGGLRAGARLPAPSPIFPRYVEEETPGAVR